MRKISANYIYSSHTGLIKNGILVIDDDGKVVELINTGGELNEESGLEYYNGIIVPGFVNAHCHLELSFLSKKIPKDEGLTSFIKNVVKERETEESIITSELDSADKQMQVNGIVAVADICNTNLSFRVKSESKISYYNLIEAVGVNSDNADDIYSNCYSIYKESQSKYSMPSEMVPHSPYGLSRSLFSLLREHYIYSEGIVSFHSQESEEEIQIYNDDESPLRTFLRDSGGGTYIDITRNNYWRFISGRIPTNCNVLLVHNVCSRELDIEMARTFFRSVYWVFCPSSNEYISNRLPDFSLFESEKDIIAVGTDSLASNGELSILKELKIIQDNSEFGLLDLLKFATINGAKALYMSKEIGSFEKGKIPGVSLIENIDLEHFIITEDTRVKVLA